MDVANLDVRVDSKSVKTASANLKGMGAASSGAMSKVKMLGGALIALGAGQAFKSLINQTNQFNSALAEVSTLLSDASSQMPTLSKNAKNLAAQFGGNPTKQVQAFYQAISAGAGDAESATELLTAANKLAIGGVTDVTTAVDGLTTIVNSFGLETKDATRVSDALFVAMKAGKTTVGELSGSVGKVAALASTAGLSFEEMLGSVSALTTGGIATSEAVTGLKAALTNILKPSGEAAKTAEALGIEFNMQAIQSKGLQGFLKDLVRQTGGNQKAMLSLFGSTEALNTVFALTGKQASTFDDIMTDMASSAGETNVAFNKVSQDMTQKFSVLKGTLLSTALTLGEKLQPAQEKSIELMSKFAKIIDEFVKSQQFTKTIEVITGALKVLSAILVSKVVVSILLASKAFLTTGASAGLATTAVNVFGVALKLAGGPIGVAIIAITGLYNILKNVFGIDFETYTRYFKAIGIVTGNALESIKGYWFGLGSDIADKFKEVFQYLTDLFTPLISFFSTSIQTIWNFYKTFYTALITGAAGAVQSFVGFFKDGFLNVDKFVALTKTNIVAFYETMKVKAASFYDSEVTTQAKLAQINIEKAASIATVTASFNEQKAAQEEIIVETGFLDVAFSTLQTTAGNVSGAFVDFTTEVIETAARIKDAETSTEDWDKAAKAASTSIGIFRTGVIESSASTKLLDVDLTSMAKPTGTFRMVTEEMTAMSVANVETNAKLLAMEEASGKAATGVEALTFEQKTFTTAVENTQTAFATLIKDTITSGKFNFSSFFESVKDGWKTMIAEFMAKKIMDAIFGGGGLTGFLSSLSSGFSGIMNSIKGGLSGIVSSFSSSIGGIVSSFTGSIGSLVSKGVSLLSGGTAAVTAASSAAAAGSAAGVSGIAAGMAANGAAVTTGAAAGGTGIAATLSTVGSSIAGAASAVGGAIAAGASAVGGAIAAGGAKVLALATGPIGLAVLATAAIAKLLDDSGTMSSNVGMITDSSIDLGDRGFKTEAFASGAEFTGFVRRGTESDANTVIDTFRSLDAALTSAAGSVGLTPTLNASDFIGSDEKGGGVGAFIGTASEDGKTKSQSISSQLDTYAARFVQLTGQQKGIDQATIDSIIGDGTASGILARTSAASQATADAAAATAAATVASATAAAEAATAAAIATTAAAAAAKATATEVFDAAGGGAAGTSAVLKALDDNGLTVQDLADQTNVSLVDLNTFMGANYTPLSSFGTVAGIRSQEEIEAIAKGIDIGAFTVDQVADQFNVDSSDVQANFDQMKIDGKFASGINRIPFDGFRAELHEGERVQSVAEVRRADLMVAEMSNLRGNLNELMLVVAKAVNKTARIESRWDTNGLPPTRT